MTVLVALLRAVNVGGTGSLPMAKLREICVACGLQNVRTYIQSGNVVFESAWDEAALTPMLEQVLSQTVGRPVGVLVRTAAAMRSILEANPFPGALPAQVGVVFLRDAVPAGFLDAVSTPGREEVRAYGRELFIHYPDGMGRSKLKLPRAAAAGTMRNLNTVVRLVAIAEA